jgi:hypothetical protein
MTDAPTKTDMDILQMAKRVQMFNALSDLGDVLDSAGMTECADTARSKALGQLAEATRGFGHD